MSNLADLVQDATLTSGTGSYVLTGSAPAYRRTMAAAFPGNTTRIPIGVLAANGAYEFGLYDWTVGTLTLARTRVLSSSNSNAAVDWPDTTEKRVFVCSHALLSRLVGMKHDTYNLSAPTANDDEDDGYQQGSLWNTGSALWVCVDATAAAAVWRPLNLLDSDSASPVLQLGGAITDSRSSGNDYFFSGYNAGYYDSGADAYSDGSVGTISCRTTDATPKKLSFKGDYSTWVGFWLDNKSAMVIRGELIGLDEGSGDIACFPVYAVVGRYGGTTTEHFGGGTITPTFASAGAATWAAQVVASGNDAAIEVTGEAATNITWSFVGLVGAVGKY